MPIVQISKIQHRSGNIQDLPQLDAAEIGIAVDLTTPGAPQNRIFVGPVIPVYTNTSPTSNNIELLNQFSGVDFMNVNFADIGNTNTYYPIMGNAVSGKLKLWANGDFRYDVPSSTLYSKELNIANSATIGNELVVGGNLYVNGDLTYINTQTLTIEDPLIQQGTGPNGGFTPAPDIKDRGAVYHFFGDGTTFDVLRFNGWDTSNGEFVLSNDVTLNANETVTINSLGNVRFANANVHGNIMVQGGAITTNQLTFDLVNTTATTVNFAGAATAINMGVAGGGGILAIRNDNVNLEGDLQVKGGDITTNQTTFNLVNTTATTMYFAGAATEINMGAATGNSNVKNNLRVSGNANVTGVVNSANTDAATSTTTGALILAGGAGIAGNVYIGGNANVTGNVNTAAQLISTIATGTAPLQVTSTTRVTNLYVQGANEANIQTVTTGNFYLNFSSALTGNLPLNANANFVANTQNGALHATTFVGNFSGNFSAPGVTQEVLFNDAGVINANSRFTFDKATGNVTSTGSFISSVATGTAPLAVTSTTRVTNLYVQGANEANIQTVTTGNFYLNFSSALTGNLPLNANANFVANTQNGALHATTFVGNFSGNFTVPGATQQVLFNDAGLMNANASFTFDKATGNLSASSFVSTVATGTAPFGVTSTTRVGSLYVQGANEANIQLVTAGTYYLNFTGATSGNQVLNANAAFSADAATGELSAGIVKTTTLTTGAAATAGTLIGTWSLGAGSSLNATYADLAEYYAADALYEPGTVLEFGGSAEVTLATDETRRVAGVVSTNPAYAMNANADGQYTVALALVGRVPCKVRGTIKKGDLMTSGGGGYARPAQDPKIGTIIGKSLEDFSGTGVIEIAVHRH